MKMSHVTIVLFCLIIGWSLPETSAPAKAGIGAGAGALSGALIGSAVGGPPGALIGAGIGGVSGGATAHLWQGGKPSLESNSPTIAMSGF